MATAVRAPARGRTPPQATVPDLPVADAELVDLRVLWGALVVALVLFLVSTALGG